MLIFECYAVELAMCCNGAWFELGERLGAGLGARSFGAQAEIWPSSTSLQGSKIFLGRLQGSPTVHVSIFPSQTAAIKAIIELAGRCCKVKVPRLITGHQVWSHLTAQTSPVGATLASLLALATVPVVIQRSKFHRCVSTASQPHEARPEVHFH
jgi:hypothetical protein